MLGTLLLALFCVILGVVVTLAVQYYVLENYFDSLPIVGPTDKPTVTQPRLPEELLEEVRQETYQRRETCLAVNLLVQMLFGELVHTPRVRHWVLNKIHLEFQELMARTSVGKLFNDIRINELDLGGQMPVFKSVTTQYVSLHPVTQTIEQLDLKLDVEYKGGLKLSILADIVLNRKGFVFLKIDRLSGQVLLRFTRRPFSHWAYSFIGDPTIEVEAESQFQGRPLPRATALIVRQIKRTLRKRHTLPNYKLRYKPFFVLLHEQLQAELPPEPLPAAAQLLEVTVKRLSRLRAAANAPPLQAVYCRLQLDVDPLLADTSNVLWSDEEIAVPTHPGQALGLLLRDTFCMERQRNHITVFIVVHNAPAYKAGIKAGDLVLAVDGQTVTDLMMANRLLRQPNKHITVSLLRMHENKEKGGDNSALRRSLHSSASLSSERRHQASLSEALLTEDSPVRRRRSTRSLCTTAAAGTDREDGDRASLRSNPSSGDLAGSVPSAVFSGIDPPKLTKHMHWNQDISVNETLSFTVCRPHRYLNISVLGIPEPSAPGAGFSGAGDPSDSSEHVLLGRLSVPLTRLVAACRLTAMGHHVELCRLLPPSTAAAKDVDDELSGHNAFEPTYCFGDVLLSFVLSDPADSDSDSAVADEDSARLLERMDVPEDSEGDDEEDVEIRVGHKFARTKFTTSTECDFCKHKIWLNHAYQCSACLMTCHKRCTARCQSQTSCTAEENRGWRDSISDSHLPEIITSSEDAEQPPGDKKRRRRDRLNSLLATLSSSSLRRTGSAQNLAPPAQSPLTLSSSLPPSPQRSPATSRKGSLASVAAFAAAPAGDCDSDEELDAALSIMQRCASNENLVLAARELGRQLYVTEKMTPAQRRDRLETMVAKLQSELDSEEARRQELLQAERRAEQPAARTRCALLLAQSDEKTKMLGILMVYYNAGLQDALQAAGAASSGPADETSEPAEEP